MFTLTGDQAKVKQTSPDGQSNDQWSWGPSFVLSFILLSSVFSFFFFSSCVDVAHQDFCRLFLCFKENIKTYTLSNFPFGMYLPFLAWPTLSRVTVARWIGSMFFFKLKLAKPQKFAEFTLFWYCTSAKSNLPLSDPAQVYFHLRSDAIFPSNKPIFISDRPIPLTQCCTQFKSPGVKIR